MMLKVIKKEKKERTSWEYLVDGVRSGCGREITGHRRGDLFYQYGGDTLYYGAHERFFPFEPFLPQDSPQEHLDKLLVRIEMVRNWIREIKGNAGSASIEIEELDNDTLEVCSAYGRCL